MDLNTALTVLTVLNGIAVTVAPVVYPIIVAHLPAGRAQRVAAAVADVAKTVHASLIEAAGTADLSAFATRERAIAEGVRLLRETGSRALAKLSDDDLQNRLRGELASIAPTILIPGDQLLPGSEPATPAPLDRTGIEEWVRSLAEERVAAEIERWRAALPASAASPS